VTLSAGTRLGPYEIVSPLGAGGMGEVYRARDIRLDRAVAIKVLPSEVASDPERLRRFEQEARAASALNHPNILTIYDVGSADSTSYIAMELIEGKTLRDLLLKGPLPVKKLLDLGVQIAEGLASAHAAGIVHRDLKPSNIVISKEGFAKILDFGLAKLPTPAPKLTSRGSDSSTEVVFETRPGTIVGTVDYMSPEQAAGEEADYQSDQFAVGSILYEMATGKRAFHRGTNLETLVAILHDEPPPLAEANFATLPPLRWIIERCLSKHPKDRFFSTQDFARDLASIRDHSSEILGLASPLRQSWKSRWRLLVAGSVATGILGLVLLAGRIVRPSSPAATMRFSVLPPEGAVFNFGSSAPAPPALAPDGTRIVFGARDSTGKNLLWVRSLDMDIARPLANTENATYPFWSPDGRSIGFFAEGKLRKISESGGAAQTLCEAPEGYGGSWSTRNVILFAPDRRSALYRVSAEGGTPLPATRIDLSIPGVSHRWPYFFPDGFHFLYLVRVSGKMIRDQGIHIGSLDSADTKLLVPQVSNAIYSSAGYIVFVREGALVAMPFDVRGLPIVKEPLIIAEHVAYHPYRSSGVFSVSGTLLTYQAAPVSSGSQLAWLDRSGRRLATLGQTAEYGGLRLSPSGRRCAAELREPRTGFIDIWIFDLDRGVSTRCTHGPSINDSPVWSPDGNRIAFASNRSGQWALYSRPASGGGEDDPVLVSEEDKFPTDWSSDGRRIIFSSSSARSHDKWGIWTYDLVSRQVRMFLETPFNEREARISPGDRFVSYTSDETGRPEIYVRAFSGDSRKWQISQGGGRQSLWRSDGQELFYLSLANRLMAVGVKSAPTFQAGVGEPLFQTGIVESSSDTPLYAAAPDGQKFLVNTAAASSASTPMTVVVQWAANLTR
jgi:serine/threonine protein kinase